MPRFHDDDLARIEPRHLAEYFISRGWRLQEEISDKATVWDLPGSEAEVWLPRDRRFSDYGKLLSEALDTLEVVENRPFTSILRDLSLTWADLTRFRVDTGMFGSATLPLTDGVKLVNNARDVFLAGARAYEEPRAAYYKKPPRRVSQFLRHLRLGQTEVGSFVVTVVSPVEGDTADGRYARSALEQVVNSVQAAREAAIRASERADIGMFDEVVGRGVSANLCDALVGVGEANPDGAVEMTTSWSTRFERREPPTRVLLDAAVIRVLGVAAQHLREIEPDVDVTIRGLVHELTDLATEEREAEITVAGDVDGASRRVRCTVGGAERQRAIEAFDRRLPIQIRGTLDRIRNGYRLSDIRSLVIVGFDEVVALPDDGLEQ